MRAQRVMGHQLLSDLFRERRIEPASDVDRRQFLVLALVIGFKFLALALKVSVFDICLGVHRDVLRRPST